MIKNNIHYLILAVAGITAAWFIGNGFKRKPSGEYISVTGMAEVNFASDDIRWSGSFSRSSQEMKDAYQSLKADKDKVYQYFKSKGIHDSEMVFGTVNLEKQYEDIRSDGNYRTVFAGYKASQGIKIHSHRIDAIESIAKESMELVENGIEFNAGTPEFYYTRLSELKLELIRKAAADASSRAGKIAEASNSSLGSLKSSDLGVFQITGENDNEEYSWGGVFNTSSKRKTARVTVSSNFATH
ncbi:MAG: SIMPL domain-containing protein [Sphingomonadales bacterium]|nr:SIMPL domain-containing protein [Sphingomonadales bacterium]